MSRRAIPSYLVLAFVLAIGLAVARAGETFTDDIGRILYTIDEDGTVSMFETSPTDLTLSVTRGTRAKMQPRVTEVTPEVIPAGTSNVLKLRGKNLVGAKVTFDAAGIGTGTYAGKPKEIDIPLTIPLNFPSGEVTMKITTPIGSTTAKLTITDLQIGSTTGAPSIRDAITHPGQGYGADDGAGPVPTNAPTSCPTGMVGVAAEGGGFCIDVDQTMRGDIRTANQTCAMAGRRLCRLSEWRAACEQTRKGRLPLQNMTKAWEWTSTYEIMIDQSGYTDGSGDVVNYAVGEPDCQATQLTKRWQKKVYPARCCK
jgi:hypothetical protein